MPTYDYECSACGHVFEVMHAMSAPALRKCPRCGKLKLRRLISGGAGVIFKGSGFYETDYRRNRPGGDFASKEAKDAPASSEKTEGKTETGSGAKAPASSEAKTESKPKKDPGAKKD